MPSSLLYQLDVKIRTNFHCIRVLFLKWGTQIQTPDDISWSFPWVGNVMRLSAIFMSSAEVNSCCFNTTFHLRLMFFFSLHLNHIGKSLHRYLPGCHLPQACRLERHEESSKFMHQTCHTGVVPWDVHLRGNLTIPRFAVKDLRVTLVWGREVVCVRLPENSVPRPTVHYQAFDISFSNRRW